MTKKEMLLWFFGIFGFAIGMIIVGYFVLSVMAHNPRTLEDCVPAGQIKEDVYYVQKGDNLTKILRQYQKEYNMDIDLDMLAMDLYNQNPEITNADQIYVGQRLVIRYYDGTQDVS